MSLDLSKQLKQADLNLLVTFHLLLKHRSVKRVADELFLSQSAVSRALGRLRQTFDDELFTRTYSGLVPTEKAKSLAIPLTNIVTEIEELIVGKEFDLSRCSENFVVAAPALIGCHLVPELMVNILPQAPNVSVTEVQPKSNPTPSLEKGEVDFVLYNNPTFDTNYFCQHLGTTPIAMYARSGHPLQSHDYLDYEHLAKYPIIGNMVDIASDSGFQSPMTVLCERLGKRTAPRLKSVQLHSLLMSAEMTDCVLLASEALQHDKFSRHTLNKLQFKEDASLSMDVYLIAMKSKVLKPEYEWFKDLIIDKYQQVFHPELSA